MAAAMLAACGGSQPPIGAQGTTPMTSVAAEHRDANPSTDSGDLIYAQNRKATYILSYATGQVVGSFDLVSYGASLCSDKRGDVFIPADKKGYIYEYAHGGTTPIAQLSDEDNETPGCSVDPITGNLAVANFYADCHGVSCANGNIAIYAKAKGNPKLYSDPTITNYVSCGYDNAGNLFVEGGNTSEGSLFAELPRGSNKFTNFDLVILPGAISVVQWDGKYVALGTVAVTGRLEIDRVTVHGSKA
ncbi:MAG: hypothetical protein ABSF08_08515, partial [Candidatus Cybelea sp.]